MLEILGTVVSSVLSGGATGLIGMVAQRWADYKNRQLDIQLQQLKNDHEVKMKEADAAIMAQEWAARTRVAEIETEGKIEAADAAAFAESFKLEPQRYATGKMTTGQMWIMVILDFFRGIIRPGLTIYLCVLTTLIYIQARNLVGKEDLTPDQAMDLMKLIIGTVLYLSTTTIVWWFGVRPQKQSK